jgi:hypothetical protein
MYMALNKSTGVVPSSITKRGTRATKIKVQDVLPFRICKPCEITLVDTLWHNALNFRNLSKEHMSIPPVTFDYVITLLAEGDGASSPTSLFS